MFAWLHATNESHNTQMRTNMFGFGESRQSPSGQQKRLAVKNTAAKKGNPPEGNPSTVIITFKHRMLVLIQIS